MKHLVPLSFSLTYPNMHTIPWLQDMKPLLFWVSRPSGYTNAPAQGQQHPSFCPGNPPWIHQLTGLRNHRVCSGESKGADEERRRRRRRKQKRTTGSALTMNNTYHNWPDNPPRCIFTFVFCLPSQIVTNKLISGKRRDFFFFFYSKIPKGKITWLLNALVLIWSFIALGEQEMYSMFPLLSQSPLSLLKVISEAEKGCDTILPPRGWRKVFSWWRGRGWPSSSHRCWGWRWRCCWWVVVCCIIYLIICEMIRMISWKLWRICGG